MADNAPVICAWCTTVVSEGVGQVSHGICVPCAKNFLEKLPRDYLQSIAEPDGTVSLFSGHKLKIATESGTQN